MGDILIRPQNMGELSKFQIKSGITEFFNKLSSYRKDTLESMKANKSLFFTNFFSDKYVWLAEKLCIL